MKNESEEPSPTCPNRELARRIAIELSPTDLARRPLVLNCVNRSIMGLASIPSGLLVAGANQRPSNKLQKS